VSDVPLGADELVRTTLQIEGATSAPSVESIVRALQRVPGVLLAEMNAASARAVVAHDGAVAPASLLAAVASAGNRAQIVTDTRPVVAVPDGRKLMLVRVAGIATVAFVGLTLVEVFLPGNDDKLRVLPLIMSIFWFIFFAQSFITRRT
jgi:cation transport ATPase